MNPELRLGIDCCRAGFARAAGDQLRPLPTDIDWARFHRLVHFHRIPGLAWAALEPHAGAIPREIRRSLAEAAHEQVAANLNVALECRRLRDAFAAAGVPLLFLKGLTVAALAYRNPLLKRAWDVDVLVPADRLADAAALLESQGYTLQVPAARAQLARWHRTHKDSLWHRDDPLVHVELHPRLVDNLRMLPDVGIGSPRQDVAVAPGVVLQTLAADELFAYLCVHGASSAWFRLKWIADLAGLIEGTSADSLGHLYRRSQELGAARAAGQALLVADFLFGTLGESALRIELASDRVTTWLASAALRQLMVSREPTGRRLGTWRIHLTQLGLRPGLRFKAGELARQVREAVG